MFVMFSSSFRIGGTSRDVTKEKLMDCNEEKLENPRVSVKSKSQ